MYVNAFPDSESPKRQADVLPTAKAQKNQATPSNQTIWVFKRIAGARAERSSMLALEQIAGGNNTKVVRVQ